MFSSEHIANHIPGSQLRWAVMDQIVVHLSINHATLPRIQTFLSHLQIGGMSTHMGASRGGIRTTSKGRSSAAKTTQDDLKVGRTSDKAWNSLCNRFTGSVNRTPSISEEPLRHQHGIELSTIVYSGKDDATHRNMEQSRSAATSLSSSREGLTREDIAGSLGGVRVQKEFHVVYDQM